MGEYQKGVNGNVRISNEGNSQRPVELHEKRFSSSFPYLGWNHIATIGIGRGEDFSINGDIKLVVPDKAFRSASDVPGGFDVHFDDVWVSLRHS